MVPLCVTLAWNSDKMIRNEVGNWVQSQSVNCNRQFIGFRPAFVYICGVFAVFVIVYLCIFNPMICCTQILVSIFCIFMFECV